MKLCCCKNALPFWKALKYKLKVHYKLEEHSNRGTAIKKNAGQKNRYFTRDNIETANKKC